MRGLGKAAYRLVVADGALNPDRIGGVLDPGCQSLRPSQFKDVGTSLSSHQATTSGRP